MKVVERYLLFDKDNTLLKARFEGPAQFWPDLEEMLRRQQDRFRVGVFSNASTEHTKSHMGQLMKLIDDVYSSQNDDEGPPVGGAYREGQSTKRSPHDLYVDPSSGRVDWLDVLADHSTESDEWHFKSTGDVVRGLTLNADLERDEGDLYLNPNSGNGRDNKDLHLWEVRRFIENGGIPVHAVMVTDEGDFYQERNIASTNPKIPILTVHHKDREWIRRGHYEALWNILLNSDQDPAEQFQSMMEQGHAGFQFGYGSEFTKVRRVTIEGQEFVMMSSKEGGLVACETRSALLQKFRVERST